MRPKNEWMRMRAGEIEQYAYCAHNWQLAKAGVQGKGGSEGQKYHDSLGNTYKDALLAREAKLKARFITTGAISLAVTLAFMVIVALVAFDGFAALEISLLALAVVQLGAGAWTVGVANNNKENRLRDEARVRGEVLEDDLIGDALLMEDPETGLRGRPDRLIELDNKVIPVEVKSGNTPSLPYRSHKLQLAAYCRLLESQEQVVTHGLLVYPERTFRVDWNKTLQEDLYKTMDAIRSGAATDRDHNHKARCVGCSRRHQCDQRLA
jgi:CRISPR/Cas system-associated exonuclease Cas4 (RecB family)